MCLPFAGRRPKPLKRLATCFIVSSHPKTTTPDSGRVWESRREKIRPLLIIQKKIFPSFPSLAGNYFYCYYCSHLTTQEMMKETLHCVSLQRQKTSGRTAEDFFTDWSWEKTREKTESSENRYGSQRNTTKREKKNAILCSGSAV